MATKTEATRLADSDNEWKCQSCGEMMGPSAEKNCNKCCSGAKADADEGDGDDSDDEMKALASAGLLGKKKSQTRANLAAFAAASMKATGATTADEALGKMKAGADALGDLATARAAAADTAAAQAKASVLGAIKAAVEGNKLSLAAAPGLLDFMDDAEADKVHAPLAAVVETIGKDGKPSTMAPEKTLEATLAAFGCATYTAKDAKRITSYLDAKGAALPTAHRAPPNTKAEQAKVHRHLAAVAPELGIAPDQVTQFAGLSIAEIEAKVEEKARAKK